MKHLKLFANYNEYNNYLNNDNYVLPNVSVIEKQSVYYEQKIYDSKIEYLQSTGTQLIDTNITPKNISTLKIICSFEINNDSRRILLGNYIPNNYAISFEIYNDRLLRTYVNNGLIDSSYTYNKQIPINTIINVESTLNFDDNKWNINMSFNNNVYKFENDIISNLYNQQNSLCMFLDKRSSSLNSAIANPLKIYNLKIYTNNNKVRDFIPVRKNEIGYMYDKVSKQLFDNSGTGDFILGSDI